MAGAPERPRAGRGRVSAPAPASTPPPTDRNLRRATPETAAPPVAGRGLGACILAAPFVSEPANLARHIHPLAPVGRPFPLELRRLSSKAELIRSGRIYVVAARYSLRVVRTVYGNGAALALNGAEINCAR